nr:PREDICTED: NAD-dependent protein deacetylase sirtuin-3-like isoform X2 [Latimeria chalumnae]|eukprot:XP_014340981.1 PREDICTED: NAD-dependent protein deacetylase sirtuin-3-like isoform X2 [Latimeria chalumnae]
MKEKPRDLEVSGRKKLKPIHAGPRGSSCTPNEPKSIPEITLARNIHQMTVSDQPTSTSRKEHSQKAGKASSVKSAPLVKVPSVGGKLKNLNDIAALILYKRCKNIIIIAGAGISTASGIPDFRTPGTGLYDNLQQYNIPCPEAIFDIDYFTYNPKPFFSLVKELYPGNYQPNYIHYFVKMLHEKGLLLKMYTQNIDGLERKAGIPSEKLVEAHGTFSTASCHSCCKPFPAKIAQEAIMNDKIPRCKACSGIVKPDIVFFGEDLPKRFYRFSKDFVNADLVFIMGTSLEIEPFASIVDSARSYVPRLLLNRDLVGPFKRKPMRNTDVAELGDLIENIKRLVGILGWEEKMDELIRAHTHPVMNSEQPSTFQKENVGQSYQATVLKEVKSKGKTSRNVKPMNNWKIKSETQRTFNTTLAASLKTRETVTSSESSSSSDTESTCSSGY